MENTDQSKTKGPFAQLVKNAGFKAAFSRNKRAIKALLNYYLPPDRQIDEIVAFEDREVQGFTRDSRTLQMDLRCIDKNGCHFIVEMQSYPQNAFFKRVVAYISSVYRETIGHGDDAYESLTPVYLVAIMNVPLQEEEFKNDHRIIARYGFRDLDDNYFAPSTLNAIFVRLNEIPNSLDECKNEAERCAYYVRNMHEMIAIPEGEAQSGIGDIFRAAQIAGFSEDKKRQYEEDLMFENDYLAQMAFQRREGYAEGHAEGAMENSMKIASNLKEMGMSVAQITKATGLTTEEIENL